jgi:two-component system, NarL family, invasion response regulator UvrY
MIRVLIADDHAVVRKGLKQIIQDNFFGAEVGEAKDASDVLDMARIKDWDVVVLDITMPHKSGLQVLKELKYEHPKLPVLVLSIYPEDQYAVRVLKSGAAGYMTKETATDQLVSAIRKVINGKKYVSPTLAEKLAFDLEREGQKPLHEYLSDREYEVMQMIANGKTVSEIARQLSLSVKTVSTYRGRILEKMQMKSNNELMRYTIRNNLID